MLDSDLLVAWPAFAAIAVWILWHVYSGFSYRSRVRSRRERMDALALTLGLQRDPDHRSLAHEKVHRGYNEAASPNWSSDSPAIGVGFGWAIDSLYQGNGLSLFEIGQGTRKGNREGVTLGVHAAGMELPPFRRHRQLLLQLGLDEARRQGKVLDLSDGSLVLLRDPANQSLSRIFSAPVMAFLESNPHCEMTGNGDEIWLTDMLFENDRNIESVFAEAASLFTKELRRARA